MYRKYTCTFGRKWTEIDWLKSQWLHVWNQLSICIESIWLPLRLFGRLEVDQVLPKNSLNVLYYVSKTTYKTLAKRPETLANWSLVKPSVTSKVHSYIFWVVENCISQKSKARATESRNKKIPQITMQSKQVLRLNLNYLFQMIDLQISQVLQRKHQWQFL